jgi:hypothetical protein
MSYSQFHRNFANSNQLSDSLENPEKYFGPNYATLLNFWWFLTTLTDAQEEELFDKRDRVFSSSSSRRLFEASGIASDHFYTGSLSRIVFFDGGNSMEKALASHEIIGMHILLDWNESLKILPLFSNL